MIISLSLCLVLIAVGLMLPGGLAHASSVDEFFGQILGNILYGICWLFGKLLVGIINILISVASYNKFIDATAVVKGWVIVRDVCNMLFIAILLLIAFGTIFKWETYRYNRLLGRLILMAVLINFSKFICGFMIDIFQVLMMTFVNGFAETAAGNITTGLGLKDMLSFGWTQTGADINFTAIMGALILALIMLIIANIVMIIMTVVFLLRIIMLWLLVILSPMAFFMRTYPGMGENFSRQWWSMFGKYLITGPLLAFFLWLALIIMMPGSTSIAEQQGFMYSSTGEQQRVCSLNPSQTCTDLNGTECGANGPCVDTLTPPTSGIGAGTGAKFSATISAIGQSDKLLSFIISIMLLIAALMFTQQLGVAGGSLAGQWSGRISGALAGAGRMAALGVATGGFGLAGYGGYKLSRWRRFGGNRIRGGALTLMSQSPGLRNTLSNVATSRRWYARPFRGMATGALVGLSEYGAEQRERTTRYMRRLPAQVIQNRARGRALTPHAALERNIARTLEPNTIEDRTERENFVSRRSEEEAKNMSDAAWAALGRSNTTIAGDASYHLITNARARGAYNTGKQVYNRSHGLGMTDGFVSGMDQYGRSLTGAAQWGIMPNNPAGPPLINAADMTRRLFRRGRWANRYRLTPESERNEEQGAGNVAAHDFARGRSDVMAVDYNQLSPETQKRLIEPAQEEDSTITSSKDIKGVTVTDKNEIRTIGQEIVKVLEAEISKLKSEGGSEEKIKELEQAKERFTNPEELEKIDRLSLVNSSSAGYGGVQDLIETKGEEDLHRAGIDSEEMAKQINEYIIQNHKFSLRGKIEKGLKGGKSVDEILKEEEVELPTKEVAPERAAERAAERGAEAQSRETPKREAAGQKARSEAETKKPPTEETVPPEVADEDKAVDEQQKEMETKGANATTEDYQELIEKLTSLADTVSKNTKSLEKYGEATKKHFSTMINSSVQIGTRGYGEKKINDEELRRIREELDRIRKALGAKTETAGKSGSSVKNKATSQEKSPKSSQEPEKESQI